MHNGGDTMRTIKASIKWMAGAAAAAAFLLAAPHQAHAAQVYFGIGVSSYGAPGYGAPGYGAPAGCNATATKSGLIQSEAAFANFAGPVLGEASHQMKRLRVNRLGAFFMPATTVGWRPGQVWQCGCAPVPRLDGSPPSGFSTLVRCGRRPETGAPP